MNAAVLQVIPQRLGSLAPGEVLGDGLDRDPVVALQLVGKLGKLGRAARNQDEVVTILGEELGQLVTDAAGGSGDEGGRSVLVHSNFRTVSFGAEERGERPGNWEPPRNT